MILSRIRALSQQRLDLEDLNALMSGVRTDSNLWHKQFMSGENHIIKGFVVTGIGSNQATITLPNSTFIIPESSTDFSWYIAESGASNITITDAELVDSARNYVEISLATETNTPVTKAFWDQSAASGAGSEFNQEVDTMTDIAIQVHVSTGGFSGNPDRIPLCYIDTGAGGSIETIIDKRTLFFRLGTPASPSNEFTWGTRSEPIITLVLTGGAGTYVAGETVTFSGGATAVCITGGTTNITINKLSGDNFAVGNTLAGAAASRTLVTATHSFTGADSDIDDFKEWMNAVMTEIKLLKGTDFWYESATANVKDLFYDVALSTITGNGRITHSDTVPGQITYADLKIKPITTSVVYTITGATQSLADGEVLYIDIDEGGNRGVTGARTMVKAARASVPFDQDTYWIAFRDDDGASEAAVYLRGIGLLQEGESQVIGEEGEKDFIVDRNVRLVRGGNWSWDLGTTTLTWSTDAYMQVPGLDENRNTIQAASSAGLDADGKVLYVDINRSGSGATNISVSSVAIGSFINQQNRFIIARRLGNDIIVGKSLILQDDESQPLDESKVIKLDEDRNNKLISGGTWSWDSGTSTLSWSADAYIQVPSLANSANTISTGNLAAIADGDIVYVDINRSGAGGSITPTRIAVASYVPDQDRIVIAQRIGTDLFLGGQIVMPTGTSRTLSEQFASTTLSNLGLTAINTSLISDTNNTDDIGTDLIEWKDGWFHAIKHNDAANPDLDISTEGNDGNINLTPNGTGKVVTSKADINGGEIDAVTIGTNSPVTEAQVDNININGNTIMSTDTDGDINVAPNGSGLFVATRFSAKYVVHTSAVTVNLTDIDRLDNIRMTAVGTTVNLPTLADNYGREITIVKDVSANGVITIDGEGSETISGSLTQTLDFYNESITIIANASEWTIINHYMPTTIYGLTVTGTGWVTNTADAIFYKTTNGVWKMRFNISGTVAADPTGTSYVMTVANVTFRTFSGGQAVAGVSAANHSTEGVKAYATSAASTIFILFASHQSNGFGASGDVELNAKPNFIL